MSDADQVTTPATTKTPEDKAKVAVEFSLLFAILASSAVKGDSEAYRDTMMNTFYKSLDSFGYKIVPKD